MSKTTLWAFLFMLLLIFFFSTDGNAQTFYAIDKNICATGEKIEIDFNKDKTVCYVGNDNVTKIFYKTKKQLPNSKGVCLKSKDGYFMLFEETEITKQTVQCVTFANIKNEYMTNMFIDSISYFRHFNFAHKKHYHYCYLP